MAIYLVTVPRPNGIAEHVFAALVRYVALSASRAYIVAAVEARAGSRCTAPYPAHLTNRHHGDYSISAKGLGTSRVGRCCGGLFNQTQRTNLLISLDFLQSVPSYMAGEKRHF